MSTATELKASVSNLRSRVKIDEMEAQRTGAAMVGAFVIGVMEKPRTGETPEERAPWISKIPDILGLPKTASIAILAKLGAQYAPKGMQGYLNGLGDAGAVIALHAFAKGEQISGMSPTSMVNPGGIEGRRSQARATAARVRELEARLARQLRASGSNEDEIDAELAALETTLV